MHPAESQTCQANGLDSVLGSTSHGVVATGAYHRPCWSIAAGEVGTADTRYPVCKASQFAWHHAMPSLLPGCW
jgi:hypothetical protein